MSYAGNPDARIRREAIKLLLESPGHTTDAILLGLRDADDAIATMAPRPRSIRVPRLPCPCWSGSRSIRNGHRISGLSPFGSWLEPRAPEALRLLLALAMTRRLWLARGLAPKSPLLLSALSALAGHWGEDASASEVLTLARATPGSRDPAAAAVSL